MSVYLTIRVLHVLAGAVWLGVAVFGAFFLMPSVRDAGPDGAKVMIALERRGFFALVPILAVSSIVSGLWLYWRYTGGFSSAISHSHAGMAFGTGGALAIVAAIIGGAVISRAAATSTALAREAATMPEGPNRTAALADAAVLRQRAQAAARVVAILLLLTAALMSVALLL